MARRLEDMFRPSNLHKVLACPASAGREAAVAATTSSYAQEGIVAHQFAAAALSQRLPAGHFVGQLVDVVECTPEMAEHIQSYVDYVHELAGPTTVMVEASVSLAALGMKSGTADALVLRDGVLHVVDFKYGAGVPVLPINNPQLLAYAIGAVDEWSALLSDEEVAALRVVLHIVQPRASIKFARWETDAARLREFGAYVTKRLGLAASPAAPYHPGEHCRFCAVKASCEALNGFAAESSKREVPADLQALGDSLSRVATVKLWVSAVEEAARTALLAGNVVPGWKLVEGRTTRVWQDEAKFVEHAKRKRLSIDTYNPRELESVAALEKTLGKAAFAEQGFAGLVLRRPGAPTVAPASDPRKEFIAENTPGADDFALDPTKGV